MAIATETTFTGFRPEAIDFLVELAANNDRAWFQPRKADYERLLKAPIEALCVALADRFAERGIPLRSDPTRSPFRIYRDVRFSKDKSPYKTHVSANFPWVEGGTEQAGWAGGYFHLQPGEVYVGGGMWHPEKERLAAFRRVLDEAPARVHEVVDDAAFVRTFGQVNGERLKRVPQGFAPDHPEAELLKLKDVTFGRRLSDADVYSPALPDTIADAFAPAVPVMRFLATLG
jgi:uncharacterized protein (TIGR02453 family)